MSDTDHEQGKPPATEAQKLLAEWLGTFFLVFVATGAIVVDGVSHGQIGRASSVVPPGLVVMAAILFLGELSGAHLNPVVTVAFAMRGDFPWARVPGYLVAQLAGGMCASLLLWVMFGNVRMLGVTEPGALVLQDFRSLWIYLLGPFGGALIAVAFSYLLRGRGHYRSESKAAQGS